MQADYRRVPLDVIREHVREQLELTSLRAVAQRSGVGRTTVHNFAHANTHPHPRVRRALALMYLSDKEGEDPERGAPSMAGEEWRRPQVQLAARVLVDTFTETEQPPPDWLTRLAM